MRIIKILTDKDVKEFNKEAPKHEVVMAGFFMVDCPACIDFKPQWEKFVKSCEQQDSPKVLIAEVDSNQAAKINFDTSTLEGFPTVLLEKKGEKKPIEFTENRDATTLKNFLKEALSANIVNPQEGGGRKKKKKRKSTRKKTRKTKKRRRVGNNKKELKRLQTQYRRFRIAKRDKRFKGTKGLVKWSRPSKAKRKGKKRSRRIYWRKR